MTHFRYRAATATGDLKSGTLEARTPADALARVRALGLSPIEATAIKAAAANDANGSKPPKATGAARKAATRALGELAVLLAAGLSLDRALTVVTDNIPSRPAALAFVAMHAQIKEGVPLSRTMAAQPGLFPPAAWAMAEAGEANGRLDIALTRLSETLDRAEQLRSTIVSSLIYPVMLLAIATGVIGLMLLVVVPQFESLIGSNGAKIPPVTAAVMAASRGLRDHGLAGLLLLALGGVVAWQALKAPAARAAVDRLLLKAPLLGEIVTKAETARFARVLGSLVEGGVPVPAALAIARRSIGNAHMGAAVDRVSIGLKQGGGLTGPLIATGLFPRIAISFMRTGEETARLGAMLERLADVLDREVKQAIGNAIGVLTPAITVVIGAVVGLVIASLMSAILGFNELAVGGPQ